MNMQCFHHTGGLSHSGEILGAWMVGLGAVVIYAMFTPYVAHDQARQLVITFGGILGLYLLARVKTVRKKIAHVTDLHWAGIHGSAA